MTLDAAIDVSINVPVGESPPSCPRMAGGSDPKCNGGGVWETFRMISIHIMYPKTDESTFDMDYYCATHMPMFVKALGPACNAWGASEVTDGPWAAVGWCHVENRQALDTALGEHGAAIAADVANYTNVAPEMIIGEIAHQS